ncbi:phosphate acyltransferase PlsX [Actinoplanes oblitus]|uniref:phosphate acyltransferase n=1 Tax=Actinoplanes oblitus TaxID=3040509 RepID=A0ABY8WVF8_9ACTN|nr:phosphate acyltransferase PlsX [Actinoplanes oblitus]WIN00948.1 phosphate acyltransferase PlsX [Actinoplanes oblitus]
MGRVVPEQWRPTGVPAPHREPGTARIAVDLLGGDHAPAVVVDGALRAVDDDPSLHLTLVGPAEAADAVLAAVHPAQRHRLTTVLGGTAAEAVAAGRADALVSAGDTAVTVLSAARALGRWPGVRRPPLAAVLPTAAGRLVLLDVGSTVDPDEQTLATHARLGAAYAAAIHDLPEPRVGLLTIGTERGKGDQLRRAAARLLEDLPLRYVGLVEGSDVVLGAAADVVVTDGFTGNVLLKALEAAHVAKNTDETRAAVLLGVGGIVVVCHGAATGPDLARGIAFAADLHRHRRIDVVQRGIA